MTVWIVEGHYDYESNICGVFANEEAAKKGIVAFKESTDCEYTRYSAREYLVLELQSS